MYDVCIIGAGVVGMNIARELTKYNLKICVLEKEEDVSCGCSKANSGIVHGGYTDKPGTLKAKLCIQGNRMYDQLNQELHFGYRETGAFVLAFEEEDLPQIQNLYDMGIQNGVQDLKVIDRQEVLKLEPHVNETIKGALYIKHVGVTSPYEFVIALAENAIANGAEIKFNAEVAGITQENDNSFTITTISGDKITTRYLINAAGIFSDRISTMVGIRDYKITPRRGQYLLLDKEESYLVNSVIFQVPTKMGKGILVTTTYHGNLMIGPNAEEIDDKNDVSTDEKTLDHIITTARKSVPHFNMQKVLKSFAGNRPVSGLKDWVIEESPVKNFIHLIGVDSPGLTASPAIAQYVLAILQNAGLSLIKNETFNPYREPIVKIKDQSFKGDINAADPQEHLICRCERVTEAEIVDCLQRGIPIRSLDAVSRRTRAGFGTCQGAFCGPRVKKLMAETLGISPEEIKEKSSASSLLAQRVKRMNLKKL